MKTLSFELQFCLMINTVARKCWFVNTYYATLRNNRSEFIVCRLLSNSYRFSALTVELMCTSTFVSFTFHCRYTKNYRTKMPCLKHFDLSPSLEDVNTDPYSPNFIINNSDINTTCETVISMFNNNVTNLSSTCFQKETCFFLLDVVNQSFVDVPLQCLV